MNIVNQFTIRILKKNKVRTLVTIIGIALAVSMFTGVTSLIESFRGYMVDLTEASEGIYHGILDNISDETYEKFGKDPEVSGASEMRNYGAAINKDTELQTAEEKTKSSEKTEASEESGSSLREYLFVTGIEKSFAKYSYISIESGRMPESQDEILLPKGYLIQNDLSYQKGDMITLKIGERQALDDTDTWERVGITEGETLKDTKEKTFRVVGIYDSAHYKNNNSVQGYYVYTGIEGETFRPVDHGVLFTLKHPEKTAEFLERYNAMEIKKGRNIQYFAHNALLTVNGRSTNDAFNRSMYAMAAILMSIIMLGSVSLIYNAFSISFSERTKLLGLFKSVGATKKQIRGSVFFEAFLLSLFGIPLGLLAGFAGIAVTLYFVGDYVAALVAVPVTDTVIHSLHLVITPESVLIAVVAGYVAILLSALIPVHKVVRQPVLTSLRQNDMIKIKGRKLKTNRLVYKLFQFEGLLAVKTYKRNRKKYRTTIFSLFVSVVLFITAASFSNYMLQTVNESRDRSVADIECGIYGDSLQEELPEGEKSLDKMKQDMKKLSRVTDVAYSQAMVGDIKDIPLEYYTQDYLSAYRKVISKEDWDYLTSGGKTMQEYAAVYFLDDESYGSYLKEHGYPLSEYLNAEKPKALVWSNPQIYLGNSKKKYTKTRLKAKGVTLDFQLYTEDEESESDDESEDSSKVSFPITVGDNVSDVLPLGVSGNYSVICVFPHSCLEKSGLPGTGLSGAELGGLGTNVFFSLKSSSHKESNESVLKYLHNTVKNSPISSQDLVEEKATIHAMLVLVKVFSYGFIALITLISLANVFNTISTNIALRRQEFGMLRSVGMERKGFRRMMNYECLIFGLKSLIGLPVALLVDYLMYHSMEAGVDTGFLVPWGSVGIAVLSVFLVTFLTMRYAYGKVEKLNPIEALREENL